MFEVLMYLFENYMDSSIALRADEETIFNELEQVGFNHFEISRALDWLEGLSEFQLAVQGYTLPPHAIRYYVPEECEKISREGRGFLLYLEQLNILDPITREIVIDRLLALDDHEIDLGRIKWVVLVALFNQPDKKSALTILQDVILSDPSDVLN